MRLLLDYLQSWLLHIGPSYTLYTHCFQNFLYAHQHDLSRNQRLSLRSKRNAILCQHICWTNLVLVIYQHGFLRHLQLYNQHINNKLSNLILLQCRRKLMMDYIGGNYIKIMTPCFLHAQQHSSSKGTQRSLRTTKIPRTRTSQILFLKTYLM